MDKQTCTTCKFDGSCFYQESEMTDGDYGDFRNNENECKHYERNKKCGRSIK